MFFSNFTSKDELSKLFSTVDSWKINKKENRDWKNSGKNRITWNVENSLKYIKQGMPIIFQGDSSLETLDYDYFTDYMEKAEVDYVLEKTDIKKKLGLGKKVDYKVTSGQHIQTRVLPDSTKANQDYPTPVVIGVYDTKGTARKRLKSLYRAGKIAMDTDTAGNYIGYMLNWLGYQNPLFENVVGVDGEISSVDEEKALKFQAISILNSFAAKRNKALKDVIKEHVGGKPLKYRLSTGKFQDLAMSLQQLEIVNLAYDMKSVLVVETTDNNKIFFDWEHKDIDDQTRPKLVFEPFSMEPQHLDSDTLLQYIVSKFGFEPDSVQALLETLHNREWITYPRVGLETAIDTPIRIVEGRKFENFMGTAHERAILKIIRDSELAFEAGKPFIMKGIWKLTDDKELNLSKKDKKMADFDRDKKMKFEYLDDEFDIRIDDKGLTPEMLTGSLIENEIGTKATRTQLLSQLKQSGVISVVNNRYQVDVRGVYMVAAYKYLTMKKYGINARPVQIYQREINSLSISEDRELFLKELYVHLFAFKIVDRTKAIEVITKIAKDMVESEKDLARLESF